MIRPDTLFTRTWLTVAAAVLIFLLFSSSIIVYYLVFPMARQAAEDLAALMVLSAQAWVELPPDTRPDFQVELFTYHGLSLTEKADQTLDRHPLETPYMRFLEEALSARLGTPVPIKTRLNDELWLWVDIPMGGHELRFRFPHERIGVQPPLVAVWLLAGLAVVTLLTSLLLVRKLNRPLERLSNAALCFGMGNKLEPLPEKGPQEIVTLTSRFNQMMRQIHELMDNRNTLLAGISHDLRTPIARMRLAVEMLSNNYDLELIARLEKDLNEMDELIGRTLEFSRGLDAAHKPAKQEEVDLISLLGEILADYDHESVNIRENCSDSCILVENAAALRRVLTNLIENAVRYGENSPITVTCECGALEAKVTISDSGPGIPKEQLEAVFRPFHRIETSRSRNTGGSGLGLAIVQQLCTAHGWSVKLLQREQGGIQAVLIIPVSPKQ
ncbi:MAG TPA: HAMP domain-containing protein [Chromatiales bacterium]|nr:HAMP domain-containing protein [Thiotrichales bacterium]HIP67686.1 HAMP domain-containing protein [Chromatiales bacterium]